MTPEEYVQLKAFARQDGALLSLLWIGAFVCYLKGLASPLLSMTSLLLIIATPFYAAMRLRHFRDYARQGLISFGRGYAFTVLTFFYAGLLLAAALFVYFTFLDNGYLLGQFTQIMNTDEGQQLMQMYGISEQVSQSLSEMSEMRPIDFALNMLSVNIMTGLLLGLPIAAMMQRRVVEKVNP
ncbi:MAG: DUF4199 domain-containing protein [Prevotella sp.]|nr:DUF4199 domain-containing protein [Prevotella sp.]